MTMNQSWSFGSGSALISCVCGGVVNVFFLKEHTSSLLWPWSARKRPMEDVWNKQIKRVFLRFQTDFLHSCLFKYKERKQKKKNLLYLRVFLHLPPFVSCGFWNNSVLSECWALWCFCIHQAVLNQWRKERARKTREILWCAFFSSPISPSLSGKASDISRQKTNSVSAVKSSVKASQDFFSPLFCSLFGCFSPLHGFISMDVVLWGPLTCFSNNNSSNPTTTTATTGFLPARTLLMPAHPLENLEPTTN